MKIKKQIRYKLLVLEEELMAIRAALDFAIDADEHATENDVKLISKILTKMRFEK